MDAPKVLKDNKRKIKVEFERTSLAERMKVKYLSASFAAQLIWKIFRYLLLIGISYIIIFSNFSCSKSNNSLFEK